MSRLLDLVAFRVESRVASRSVLLECRFAGRSAETWLNLILGRVAEVWLTFIAGEQAV